MRLLSKIHGVIAEPDISWQQGGFNKIIWPTYKK
jgi:hypothetical protein